MPKANPDKGEALLGGKHLRMTFGSWRAFEHSSGRKLPEHMVDLSLGLSCDDYVAWLRAFAVDELSEEDALALLDEVGFPATIKAIQSLAKNFFGEFVEDEQNPPKAA